MNKEQVKLLVLSIPIILLLGIILMGCFKDVKVAIEGDYVRYGYFIDASTGKCLEISSGDAGAIRVVNDKECQK